MISAKLSVEEARNGQVFFAGYGFHVKVTVTASLSFIFSPCLRCVFCLSTRDQIKVFTGFSNHSSKFPTKSEKINLIGFTDRP